MTQTLSTAPVPQHAMVLSSWKSGIRLHFFSIASVASAREEFGPTLEDARAFVAETACNECGVEQSAVKSTVVERICHDCGTQGCDCVLTEDPHWGDLYWCEDCNPRCGCGYCTGDC